MATTLVVGSNRRDLIVTLKNDDGSVVNLTGGSARLQGKSTQGTPNLDILGTLEDAANGVVRFSQAGTFVTAAQLATAAQATATYHLRVKFVDSAAKTDYGPAFEMTWTQTPV